MLQAHIATHNHTIALVQFRLANSCHSWLLLSQFVRAAIDSSSSKSYSFSSSEIHREQALLVIQLAMQNTIEFFHTNE